APRLCEGLAERLRSLGAVEAWAVAEEDMLGIEPRQSLWREEAQERVDAEPLVPSAEVAQVAESVGADEDPLLGEPEGDLAPDAALDDRENDEGRAFDLGERRLVKRDT